MREVVRTPHLWPLALLLLAHSLVYSFGWYVLVPLWMRLRALAGRPT